MKTNYLKTRKMMLSYFLRSIFTLALVTSVACSDESATELINESATELTEPEPEPADEDVAESVNQGIDIESIIDVADLYAVTLDTSSKKKEYFYRFTCGWNLSTMQLSTQNWEKVMMHKWKENGTQRVKQWYIGIPKTGEGFYIRNRYLNTYLKAEGNKVVAKKLEKDGDKDFLWKFQGVDCRTGQDPKTGKCHKIFNVKSNKYLTTESVKLGSALKLQDFFEQGVDKFTWHAIEM